MNAIKPRTIISQVGLMNVNLLSPFRYFKMAAFIYLGNVFLYFLTLVPKGEKYTFIDQCDTGLNTLDATDSHNSRISFTLNTLLRSDSDSDFHFTVLLWRFTTSLTTCFNNVFLQLNLVFMQFTFFLSKIYSFASRYLFVWLLTICLR